MHPYDMNFALQFADRIQGRVLDVGSFNVNGALRDRLPITVGVDAREGPGVDVVCLAENLVEHFGPESFDAVCSVGTLEHMENWKGAMQGMWGVLKTGGLLMLSMARNSKGLHAYPHDYWRMPMPMFLRMFGSNQVLGSFDDHPSIGAAVVKGGPLFLDFTPDTVL